MDIIDYAMRMELDGKMYYEQSAQAMPRPELKLILQTLADEEVKHYHFFKRLKESGVTAAKSVMDSAPSSAMAIKNVFQQLVDGGQKTLYGDDVRAVWQKALEVEEKAEKLYRDESAKEKDAERREMLTRIADEEKTHVYLIDNMLSFMADPAGFVDSANFRSFQSWEGR
jgi:rubrerythrin